MTASDPCREKFEEWYTDNGTNARPITWINNDYATKAASMQFKAWKAAWHAIFILNMQAAWNTRGEQG